MMARIFTVLFSLSLALPLFAGNSTSFVYQGELTQGGVPADGSFDLQFDLYSTSAGGAPITSEFADAVQVSDGVFTTELTFTVDFTDYQGLWIEAAVRPAGGGSYTALLPRQALMPTPFARTALGAAPNSIDSGAIEQGAVHSGDVDSDDIQLRVDNQCASGSAIRVINENGSVTCQPVGGTGDAWSLSGNAGTNQGSDYLGTSDNVAFDVRTNNQRAMRYQWGFASAGSPNLIGGHSNNTIPNSNEASVIAGGGLAAAPNSIAANYGFIGGGVDNQITGSWGSIPGGSGNRVAGNYSLAAGRGAQANHDNSFVWNDGGTFASTANDQFLIDAAGGFGFGVNNPSDSFHLSVPGTRNAMRIQIDGTTRFRVFNNGGVTVGVNSTPPAAGLRVQGEILTNTPVARWYQVGAADWVPWNETIDHFRTAGVFTVSQNSAAFLEAFAPVHLPHGAVVTELAATMRDNQATGNIQIRLERKENLSGNAGQVMAAVSTNGASATPQTQVDDSISFATIDNQTYSYYLTFDSGTPSGNQDVYGVRVAYTSTTVVD